MTEGGIARWEKKEGESFSAGDLLLQIETDKAQMDVEAQDDGILVKILTPEGSQNVPVNTAIAIIAEEGDDISSIDISTLSSNVSEAPAKAEAQPAAPAATPAAAPSKATADSHSGDTSAHGLLSPAVTFAIHSNHIANANEITGSGPKGRILKGDVLRFLNEGKAVIDKSMAAAHAPPSATPKVSSTTTAAPKSTVPSTASADAEIAFLVNALEPSVLRHLAELEIAKKSVTVQVPAEKLAKLIKSNKALNENAFALRAAALALHQVALSKDGSGSVGVAVEGAKTPGAVEIANASTISVVDLAASIKDAKKGLLASSTSTTPTVILASEGMYTPDTLPNATVVVVGKPHAVVSSVEAGAALDSALDDLIGTSKTSSDAAKPKKTTSSVVINVSVISESPAASAYAAKIKGFLSNPELLTF
ncbi:pyridoxine biosynthesis protein [Coemansia sp. RSA 1933]|nr:pyridoxine biosynthesis protein [Coemansia sp. RSA 1933]